MAALVRSASTEPTFSDQSHLRIPTQGLPERMGRGRSRSESRLSLPRSDSVFSLSRMRPPSAASSSGTVASHSRRQVYTVDRGVLLAKAGIRAEGTPAPSTPLRLVNKTRRIVGTISVADLMVIAKGVPLTGLQQARSSRAQSVASAPHYMVNDASYAREQRYSSLGALQTLGKTPWDLLGLNNEEYQSSKDDKDVNLKQFLRQQSSPTSEWATGLKGKATRGRFAAGSHGCLNLNPGVVRSEGMGSSHARSLDNVHFLEYNPMNRRHSSEDAASPISPPSQRRGVAHQQEEDFLSMLTPPTSRTGHRDDAEDADDEEDWLSLLSPSAAKSLRALDEAERPYASHRRRKSRKHHDHDEEESPASGSPPPARKHQRTKRSYDTEVASHHGLSAEENIIQDNHGESPMRTTPETPRRRPVGNISPLFSPKAGPKRTTEYGRSNSMPLPSRTEGYLGKLSPLGSPSLKHRWTTKSNLSPVINPEFDQKHMGGLGLFDIPPLPGSPKVGYSPILKRAGGTPPSPRTPVTKQRRVKLKNIDAKWPSPLSPDSLRKQMMETESAETAPIAEEVINPDFEILLNLLISESAKLAASANQSTEPLDLPERRKSPSPLILVNDSGFNESQHETEPMTSDANEEQTLRTDSKEIENDSSFLQPVSRSKSPSPFPTASQFEVEFNNVPPRPPSFADASRLSPTVPLTTNTSVEGQEALDKFISGDAEKTFTELPEFESSILIKTNSEPHLQKASADIGADGSRDWLSLLSPTGARSMRALSEAERPYASIVSSSKEQLNSNLSSKFEETSYNQKSSRSPSPFSVGSLKGTRARPSRPPLPFVLQNKGSTSSNLDLKSDAANLIHWRGSDIQSDRGFMNEMQRSSESQGYQSHYISQQSVTSETSFESYELTPPKKTTSRSSSLCSSLLGKRERPSRPPLPLALQASMSSNLNLQPIESDENAKYAQYQLGMAQQKSSSPTCIEATAPQNEPAVIPCNLTQKRGSRSPSPYYRTSELRREETNHLPSGHSPFELPTGNSFPQYERKKSGSRSISPYAGKPDRTLSIERFSGDTSPLPAKPLLLTTLKKSASRSPSPYSKASEVSRGASIQLSRGPSSIALSTEQTLSHDVSQKQKTRTPSPYSKLSEFSKKVINKISRDSSPRELSQRSGSRSESSCAQELLAICDGSQKTISRSASPNSRASGERKATPTKLVPEASASELIPGTAPKQHSRSVSPRSATAEHKGLLLLQKTSSTNRVIDSEITKTTTVDNQSPLLAQGKQLKIGTGGEKFETVDLNSETNIDVQRLDQAGSRNESNEMRDRVSVSSSSEQKKPRPSPPPPLSLYRRSPVLLSSILPACDKTSNEKMQSATEEEESISQSYRFHDLYTSAGQQKIDRVTYTKDDIKAILRGEKPIRPPPPAPFVRRRLSSDSSLGENGDNKNEADKNRADDSEQTNVVDASPGDDVGEGKPTSLEEAEVKEVTQTINTTAAESTEEECQSSQIRPLVAEDHKIQSEDDHPSPPPPPPPRLNQRRRSCSSLASNKKEEELAVKPTEVTVYQAVPENDVSGEVSFSHGYIYDVYATTKRRSDRSTYTRDDIKAILSGDKPIRPPRPSLHAIHKTISAGSSLENPNNDIDLSARKDSLTDITSPVEKHTANESNEQTSSATDNLATLDSTLVEMPSDKAIEAKKIETAAPKEAELLVAQPQAQVQPLPVAAPEPELKVAPKRPTRPPPPKLFLTKSASSANISSPQNKTNLNASPVRNKRVPHAKPHGSRSPSPITFTSVRGIGNTRLPMRPPLPVNIFVQQWLDKQCKPNQ